jgi:hypothetical protein
VAILILLLAVLAALVGALVSFDRFRSEIRASNRRVPAATKGALAPPRDASSTPQLVLILFDRATLVERTDPGRRVISFLAIPGTAHLPAPVGTTVADVLSTAGPAGLVRFARTALDLQVTHIALLRLHDVPPLVDAVGGIQIQDASSFGGPVPAGKPVVLDGADAKRYIASTDPSTTRADRERAVLEAIITRLSSATSPFTLSRLARTFSAGVATDLSPSETLALALVRLSSRLSVQCGLPDESTLDQAQSNNILRQFEAATPAPRKQSGIFPASGCRAAPLASAPAAVVFFGKQALALFPFAPELAAVAIVLDVMLLLALLGVPQALVGMVRSRRKEAIVRSGRKEGMVTSGREEGMVRSGREDRIVTSGRKDRILRSGREEGMVRSGREEGMVRSGREDRIVRSGQGDRRRPHSSSGRKRFRRRSATLRAAVGRKLRPHGGFRSHPDAALVLVGSAISIFLGYLAAHL